MQHPSATTTAPPTEAKEEKKAAASSVAPSRAAKPDKAAAEEECAPPFPFYIPLLHQTLADEMIQGFNEESLRPVTIKQLLDIEEPYPGAEYTIDERPVTQITLVGQVRSVSARPTNITYRLDDGTGLIDVKKWVDPDREGDADPRCAPDQYVRVWGRMKTLNQKRHVGATFLRPVDDFNEVGYHLLEATYVHLCFTRGKSGGAAAGGDGQQGGGGGDSMFVDQYGGGGGGGGNRAAACSANAQRMFNFLQNSAGGNEGLHMNVVATGTNLGVQDVLAAADELLGHGLIYPTIDDETWALLDY